MGETFDKKARLGNTVIGIGLAVFLAAIALFMLFSAYMEWREFNDSRNWETTTAEITFVGVKEVVDDEDVFFAPDVRYLYRVGDKVYEGKRVSFDNRLYGVEQNAQDAAEMYTKGQQVEVYYKRSQPDRAVLVRTTNWAAITIYSIAGVVLLLCGIIIIRGTIFAAADDEETAMMGTPTTHTQGV